MFKGSAKLKRVLIVDDESTLLFFLRQGIQEAKIPCHVEVAPSGEHALTMLNHQEFDLVVTDLKMPGISGFTLVKKARSLNPQIKTVVMTAFGSREVENEVQNLAVSGYLTKPFPTADLVALIQDILAADNNVAPNLVPNQIHT